MNRTRSLTNVRLTVEEGTLWITGRGQKDDWFVGPGETVDLVGPGWVAGPVSSGSRCRYRTEPLALTKRPARRKLLVTKGPLRMQPRPLVITRHLTAFLPLTGQVCPQEFAVTRDD